MKWDIRRTTPEAILILREAEEQTKSPEEWGPSEVGTQRVSSKHVPKE